MEMPLPRKKAAFARLADSPHDIHLHEVVIQRGATGENRQEQTSEGRFEVKRIQKCHWKGERRPKSSQKGRGTQSRHVDHWFSQNIHELTGLPFEKGA